MQSSWATIYVCWMMTSWRGQYTIASSFLFHINMFDVEFRRNRTQDSALLQGRGICLRRFPIVSYAVRVFIANRATNPRPHRFEFTHFVTTLQHNYVWKIFNFLSLLACSLDGLIYLSRRPYRAVLILSPHAIPTSHPLFLIIIYHWLIISSNLIMNFNIFFNAGFYSNPDFAPMLTTILTPA